MKTEHEFQKLYSGIETKEIQIPKNINALTKSKYVEQNIQIHILEKSYKIFIRNHILFLLTLLSPLPPSRSPFSYP